ncbi:MAG: hypothetical protein JXR51_11555 [Bacteroidales bacterium]|nr:hypothetical protein [Bacteroidales bacterium]MBN2757806.1 hypothetical protein [Bacteroidales bacterium]
MELEDIFYIVLTIIIFIISILGQKKKKKPIIASSEEVEYSLNDFEKILERRKIVAEEEIKNDFDSNQNEQKEEEILDHVSEKYKFTKDEINDVKDDIIQKKSVDIKNENENEEENEDGFDLKSAILYSSILERKKYRH